MLKRIAFLCVFSGCFMRAAAQEAVAVQHYVFEHFSKGTVLQKNGSVDEAMLNYNVLSSEIVFESAPGQFMALAFPENVDTVFILGRRFIPVDHEFYELLVAAKYPLLLQFGCTVKEPGQGVGYGMTSVTGASTAVKSLIQNAGAYKLVLPDGFEVVPVYNYFVRKDGRYYKISNARQILALAPGKKEALSEFIKKNNTNFTQRQDMIDLVNQMQQ